MRFVDINFFNAKKLAVPEDLVFDITGKIYLGGSDREYHLLSPYPTGGLITSVSPTANIIPNVTLGVLTADLTTTTVTAGSYTSANITVDAFGRITAAASGGGGGTVTAVSVVTANGFAGSSSGGATPALTLETTITGLLKGNGTAISAAVANTDYQVPIVFTTVGTSGASSFDGTNLNIPIYQAAGTYVTSVGATLPIVSSGGTTPTISTSMATNKLIGRATALTGVMEEITLGTGLAFTGTTLNVSGFAPLTHDILSVTHSDTLVGTVVRGDVIVGNSTPKWSRMAIGSAGKILRSDGTDLLYTTSTFADTYGVSTLLYASAVNVVTGLATVNNGTLITNGTGIPTWLAAGTNGFVLTMTAGAPVWAASSGGSGITINTTAITSGTAGRVLFESATNKVSESANFAWDTTNNRLLIGAPTSTAQISIRGSGAGSGTSSLFIENSTPTTIFKLTDDGNITLKADQTILKGTLNFIQSNVTNQNIAIGEFATFSSSGTGNVVIGRSAWTGATSASNCIFIGAGAGGSSVQTGSNNTVVGTLAANAITSGACNVVIGTAGQGISTASNNVVIGFAATVSNGDNNVFIGRSTTAGGSNVTGCVALGYGAGFSGGAWSSSIALGREVVSTASNQLVCGSGSYPIYDIYFGRGTGQNGGATSVTIQNSLATGANIATTASTLIFACARGTGTGDSGDILFSYSPAIAAGSTLQTLVNGMTFDGATGTLSLVNDFKITTAGKGIYIKEGANATSGVATLVAGTVVVSTTKVTANSRIQITANTLGTITVPVGYAISARTAGTSFTILSGNLVDTSTVAWTIIEPA